MPVPQINNQSGLADAIWDMLPDLVLIYSGDEILYCNDAGLNILGSRDMETVAKVKFIRLIDPEFRNLFINNSIWINDDINEFRDVLFITINFKKIWLQVQRRQVFYNNREGVLLFARNIDNLKRLEDEKKGLKEDLERMLLEGLTRRERTILKLYGEGKNRVAISRQLDVEEGTIDRHTTNIKKKLRIKSMKQLLNFALDLPRKSEDYNEMESFPSD